MSDDKPSGEVYLEWMTVGESMRLCAVDARTGVEVVVTGPAKAPRSDLERIALRKLKRRMAAESAAQAPPASDRRGRLV
ncbi:MAG: serine hydroxymethyltransferase [Pseudomonadota bacterium]